MYHLPLGKVFLYRAGFLLAAAAWVFTACVPPEGPGSKQVRVDLSDPVARDIWAYQNEHRADSLIYFLSHPQATYRYLAALSFASFQAPALADSSLLNLLNDPVDSVRMAAAYAIGQWRDSSYAGGLADGFDQRDTAGRYRRANAAILEAIGKCAPASYLDFLANITSYRPTDTVLQEGLAWGIYRFGLRNITSRAGTRRMVGYVLDGEYDPRVRRVAAYYLSRIAGDLTDLPDQAALIRAYTTEQDLWTRWALSVAAGKTGSDEALQALQAQYLLEEDERLRGEIMKALRFLPYEAARPLALRGLRDGHPLVHWMAARFFLEQGNPADLNLIASWALNDSLSWPARLTMARATMRHFPPYATQGRRAFSYQLRFAYLQAADPYQKAAWLQAVAEEGWNYRFIRREGFKAAHPAVRTASVAALRAIAGRPDFEDYFGPGYRGRSAELAVYFREAIATGDPGMISEAAAALRIPERDFGRYLDSLSFLDRARSGLQLPQDLEAARELDHALAYLKGETHQPGPPPAARAVSWDILRKDSLTVRLDTEKGTIELELWPRLAPATVSAFLDLAGQGFYEGKSFHRVVPNFVVQDGCPRGDGYGGPDFLLRSELPYLHYDEGGYIGMASAGRHTEGSQFFITQVPTPHLDGRYTLFGRVRSGEEALTRIMPGDSIVQFTVSQ